MSTHRVLIAVGMAIASGCADPSGPTPPVMMSSHPADSTGSANGAPGPARLSGSGSRPAVLQRTGERLRISHGGGSGRRVLALDGMHPRRFQSPSRPGPHARVSERPSTAVPVPAHARRRRDMARSRDGTLPVPSEGSGIRSGADLVRCMARIAGRDERQHSDDHRPGGPAFAPDRLRELLPGVGEELDAGTAASQQRDGGSWNDGRRRGAFDCTSARSSSAASGTT